MQPNHHMTPGVTCHNLPDSRIKKSAGLLSSLFLILLPKCPFCIMAYSSTVMLCSAEDTLVKTSTHTSTLTIGLVLFFSLITIISLAMNYRDRRTVYSLGLAIAGSGLTLCSVVYSGGEWLYYTGLLITFSAIWLNGSLMHFMNKLKSIYKKPQNPSNLIEITS